MSGADADRDAFVARAGGIDVGKREVVACVRVPAGDGLLQREQQVRRFSTVTAGLLELADWLRVWQVQRVAMESTSDYWKPVYFLLEAEGLPVCLVNAAHVKNLPGRPKTDQIDAVWLTKVLERGMCRPSVVPPEDIRTLRDLTRYRTSRVRDQVREKQRVEKLLEGAGIKLSSVVSDLFGVSGRAMLAALAAGEGDPATLAELARGSLRGKDKTAALKQALHGRFMTKDRAWLLGRMLAAINSIDAEIAEVDQRIERALTPFRRQHEQLITIPGVGALAAAILIAEIGTDMTLFPSGQHLAAWAGFAPQERSSAGTRKRARTGRGSPYLAAVLGEIVAANTRSNNFYGARYRRLIRRGGPRLATVAVANSILRAIWHILSDENATYRELGADYHTKRTDPHKRQRSLVRELETITGKKVTLTDHHAA